MPIDTGAVGLRAEPFVRSWESSDALLYALSVGAGQEDAAQELQFTTENTGSIEQQVIPSFAITLVQTGLGKALPFGDYPKGSLVHAEQSLTLHRPVSPRGSLTVSAHIASITDKGSGALVHIETEAVDPATGERVASTRLGYFIRGQGGFGGAQSDAGGDVPWAEPHGDPDMTIGVATRKDQALLYRLNGDRNPLHSDPAAAAAAGFPRPILHGLATYGIATRVLTNVLFDGDPTRFKSVSARFTAPVYPGEELEILIWRTPPEAVFRILNSTGARVLDRGTLIGDFAGSHR